MRELELADDRRAVGWWVGGVLAMLGLALVARYAMRPAATATTSGAARITTGIVRRTAAALPTDDVSPDPPVGTLRLAGRVVDEDQHAVAGADVMLWPGDRTVVSGADGAFAFEQVMAGSARLEARAGDRYAVSTLVKSVATSGDVALALRRGATLVVRVLADGVPLAGARAVVAGRTIATSERDGVVRIGGVGRTFGRAEVVADGYAPESIALIMRDDPGGTVERTMAVWRGASVDGRVLGPNGAAVPDATVEIEAVDDRRTGWTMPVTATADQRGAWHVDAIAAGRYLVRARSRSYGPSADEPLELDGITLRHDQVVRVQLGAQLVGTVVDVAGQPVAGAEVSASAGFQRRQHQVRTGANGRFAIFGMVAGDYDVGAKTTREAASRLPVTIANGERVDVALVVVDARISGTVVDPSGAPVAGASVSVSRTFQAKDGKYMGFHSAGELTDAQGRFELGGLEPATYQLSATWPEPIGLVRDDKVDAKVGARDVRLVLAAPATLTGRILLDGAPVPYFGVAVVADAASSVFMPQVVRAADGRFALRPVTPGSWVVLVIAPGTERKVIASVALEPGRAVDLGDIALVHGPRIAGHVRDPRVRPSPTRR